MMKPSQMQTIHVDYREARVPRRVARFKGEILPETFVANVCPRLPVAAFPPGFLKVKWSEALEQNQKIASCCRHPENHTISAHKSHPNEPAPDIYHFHCDGCNRIHRFVCLGLVDDRPSWSAEAA